MDKKQETIAKFSALTNTLVSQMMSQSSQFDPTFAQEMAKMFETQEQQITQENLSRWLSNPSRYAKQLQATSKILSNSVMLYDRAVSHFASILTCHYEPVCVSDLSKVEQDGKVDELLKSKQKCYKTLKKLRIKQEYPNIVMQIAKYGAGFYYKAKSKDFITLYPLPMEYCYIQCKSDLGYRFALDLSCFDQFLGQEEVMPELYKRYEVFVEARKLGMSYELLKQVQYVMIPEELGWCFTFNPIEIDTSPPMSGAFKDVLEIPTYKNMLYTKSMLDTVMLIAQTIPMDDNGEFDLDEAERVITTCQRILPRGVRTFGTPYKSELFNLSSSQTQNNIIGLGESNFFGSSGISGTMYGADSKSALSLDYSLQGDYNFMKHIYAQLENFTNFILETEVKGEFKWHVKFFGNAYRDSKDKESYRTDVQMLKMPIQRLAAYEGYEPFEFENIALMEKLTGIKDIMQPIIPGTQMSAESQKEKAGRNLKDVTELSDTGVNTREYESNQNSEKVKM